MTLTIRKADQQDKSVLHRLRAEIYRAHFAHLWQSASELDAFLAADYGLAQLESSLSDDNVSWWIAENAHPVGFAKVTWSAEIPNSDLSGVMLNKLYLHPAETGSGSGKQMFDQVVTLAREQQRPVLWLEVLQQNRRAQQFYAARGMKTIREVMFSTASQQSVVCIMAMDL